LIESNAGKFRALEDAGLVEIHAGWKIRPTPEGLAVADSLARDVIIGG